MLDGVLGGEHEERLGQRERLAADRHLALLHRLEQRALHFGRRSVDLVGQQDVGEDRARLHGEVAGALVEDLGADEVGGEQVGRELHPPERARHRRGEGADGEGLGKSGHAFEQHVAVGQESR